MTEPLADQIMGKIGQAAANYYRLLVVVSSAGGGKTAALRDVHARIGAPLLNVNLDLSRQMLDLTERLRTLKVPGILAQILDGIQGDTVLLDNMEILFGVQLKQDPLRLLQGLSRNKTIVVAWNGSIENGHLTYAAPGHPEHRKYPIHDFLVVAPDATV